MASPVLSIRLPQADHDRLARLARDYRAPAQSATAQRASAEKELIREVLALLDNNRESVVRMAQTYGAASPLAFLHELIAALDSGDPARVQEFIARLFRLNGDQLDLPGIPKMPPPTVTTGPALPPGAP